MSEDKIEVNMNVYDIPILVEALEEANKEIERLQEELKYTIPIVEHNQTIQSNIKSYNKLAEYSKELEDRIDEAIEYVESLSSKGRDCDIYDDIKQEILRKLKGSDKE